MQVVLLKNTKQLFDYLYDISFNKGIPHSFTPINNSHRDHTQHTSCSPNLLAQFVQIIKPKQQKL